MGKIKKILENELVGGIQTTDVYPVTSTKAVYDENNERLDNIINKLYNTINKIEPGIIYDVSANNDGAVFESLQALLSSSSLNTLIPTSVRCGGVSIRFIQSSDNRYVQYRLAAPNWSTDIHDWTSEDPYFVDKIMQEVNEAIDKNTPIEIHGNVTNAPDEEDLTSVNVGGTDVLKFKDKAYDPLTYSGMGRIILRKNIVSGVNTLTQTMINKSNTIYIIQYDFNLGENITIPENCILEFDGGSISGNTLVLNNGCKIKGNGKLYCSHSITASNTNKDFIKVVGSNIEISGVEIYSDITYNYDTTGTNDNIIVAIQCYSGNNINIHNTKIHNVSAAIGLDTCSNVAVESNNIYDCFSNSKVIYGYGVVPNQSSNVIIDGNIMNNIERHGIYISLYNSIGENITVSNNIFNGLIKDTYYGYEFIIKIMSAKNVIIDSNIIHSYRGILMMPEYTNGENVKICNNIINTDSRIFAIYPSEQSVYTFNSVEVENNTISLTGTAGGFVIGCCKYFKAKNNTIISTSDNDNYCFYLRDSEDGTVKNLNKLESAIFEGNHIKNFSSYISMSNVAKVICDDFIDYAINYVCKPVQRVENVDTDMVTLSPLKSYKDYKRLVSNGYIYNLRYFDNDFAKYIKCVDNTNNIWIDDNGVVVAGGVNNRPNVKNSIVGQKYFQITSANDTLMLYFSGIEWQVEQRYIPNAVSTAAELVAINWPRSYFCIPVYCIETKKPYWFDAYALKWKDAMGNELTV